MENLLGKILRKQVELPTNQILASFANEDWERMFAFNTITQERYYPKSLQNSHSATLSVTDFEQRYPEVWEVFSNQIKSHVLAHKEQDVIAAEEVRLMQYGAGDHIKVHDDKGDIVEDDRVKEVAFTSLLYLSEVEGGELVLPEYDIVVPCRAGELVSFPAEVQHGVNKIVSGKRFVAMYRYFQYKD